MTTIEKMFCAVALFVGWFALVLMGKTEVGPLIAAMRDALIALGVFSATITNPKE